MPVYHWDLVGGDPAPGNPAAYTDLSRLFGDVAGNAQSAHGRLKALKDNTDDSIWKGKAADAFREEIDKLPEHLSKLMQSYQKASEAMTTYGNLLRELQGEANTAVGAAETANTDEYSAMNAKESSLYTDPTAPTTHHDEAAEAARTRLRSARRHIDDIRARRVAAEGAAVDGLDAAHDIGMKNRSGFHKWLGRIASVAEGVAFVLSVVAIAIVVCVALSNPAGLAALLAGFAAASGWFTAATAFSAAAVGIKYLAMRTGDESITGSALLKEAAWVAGSWATGQAAGAIGKSMNLGARTISVTTSQFSQTVTELRPVLRIITATDDLLVLHARTTTTVVRITQISAIHTPANLGAIWDTATAIAKDIPEYISKTPAFVPLDGGASDSSEALADILGPAPSCTAVHTRISGDRG